jgi:hypothetical protein
LKEVLMVPKSLRTWFVIHFIADYLFGLPLLIAPVWTMTIFGWITIDPVTTRLVGAALLGIGGESLLVRNATIEIYRAMLNLKIIWSLSAILGILLSILDGSPPLAWGFLAIFAGFSILWIGYRFQLRGDL